MLNFQNFWVFGISFCYKFVFFLLLMLSFFVIYTYVSVFLFKLILASNSVEWNIKDEEQPVDEIIDNRLLMDNNTAQSLSGGDIEVIRWLDFLIISPE